MPHLSGSRLQTESETHETKAWQIFNVIAVRSQSAQKYGIKFIISSDLRFLIVGPAKPLFSKMYCPPGRLFGELG